MAGSCDKLEVGRYMEDVAWLYWSFKHILDPTGLCNLTSRYVAAASTRFGPAAAEVARTFATKESGIMLKEWTAQNIHRPGFSEVDSPEFLDWSRRFLYRERAKASLGESHTTSKELIDSLCESPEFVCGAPFAPQHLDVEYVNEIPSMDISMVAAGELTWGDSLVLRVRPLLSGFRWTLSSGKTVAAFVSQKMRPGDQVWRLYVNSLNIIALFSPEELKEFNRRYTKLALGDVSESAVDSQVTELDDVINWGQLAKSLKTIQSHFSHLVRQSSTSDFRMVLFQDFADRLDSVFGPEVKQAVDSALEKYFQGSWLLEIGQNDPIKVLASARFAHWIEKQAAKDQAKRTVEGPLVRPMSRPISRLSLRRAAEP